MHALIVTYCFGRVTGQALIGVYKRGLRVGHALCDRGHDVSFYCAGREHYRDEMVIRAERRMTFVDALAEGWPRQDVAQHRRDTLAALARIAPDVVVIGEAPLAGPMLALTLAAIEGGVPVVCLDNAYGADSVGDFCQRFGALYDGVVLAGPSSFHAPDGPAYLKQVPPFVDPSAAQADALLAELGVESERLVTVLAYDLSVEELGASLLTQLNDERLGAIFLTPTAGGCRQRLAAMLPAEVHARTRVIEAPGEGAYFGLLQRSHLAVVKLGYMQVTECVSLGTPVIGVHFAGLFHLDLVPEVCHQLVHSTDHRHADHDTVARARAFLDLDRRAAALVHDGSLDAAGRTVAFLESLPRTPRRVPPDTYGKWGLTDENLIAALSPAHGGETVRIGTVRMGVTRELRKRVAFSVVCEYEAGAEHCVRRLWHWRFRDRAAFDSEMQRAQNPLSQRRLHWINDAPLEWAFIEDDIGEAALPPLNEAEAS